MPASTDSHTRTTFDHEHVTRDDASVSTRDRPPMVRFYMSGDLRAATGLSRTHLDFYLREGIVEPTARTESGYLLFDDAERERLEEVIGWRRDGVKLREIRRRLGRERHAAPSGSERDDT